MSTYNVPYTIYNGLYYLVCVLFTTNCLQWYQFSFLYFDTVFITFFLQEDLNVINMGHQVIIFDFSAIRGLWEIRVKKHKEKQKKEKERVAKSALEK